MPSQRCGRLGRASVDYSRADVFSPAGQNLALGFSPRERGGVVAVCPGPIERGWVCGVHRGGGSRSLDWAQGARLDLAARVLLLEETPGAVPSLAAVRFRGAGVPGLARGRPLPADQSHGDDLSDSARFALVGGRALALDPHLELPDERPVLRL